MRAFVMAGVCGLLLCAAAGSSAPTLAAQVVLPEAPGRDVTVKLCGNCHAPETVASVRHAPDGWREVIARMVAAGAKGTAQELSATLGVTSGTNGAALILEVASYFGRANPNIWSWVKAKMEAPPSV